MSNKIYSEDINECHERIKKLREEKSELYKKYKVRCAEKSYYQSMYEDTKRSCERLKSKIKSLERGYKQSDNFDIKKSGIYRVYNIHNGKSYVGQSSIDVEARCWSHFSDKIKYEAGDWHLDVQAHPENYYYEIIKKGVKNQAILDMLEVYYIGYYHCLTDGYNKSMGGRFNDFTNAVKMQNS